MRSFDLKSFACCLIILGTTLLIVDFHHIAFIRAIFIGFFIEAIHTSPRFSMKSISFQIFCITINFAIDYFQYMATDQKRYILFTRFYMYVGGFIGASKAYYKIPRQIRTKFPRPFILGTICAVGGAVAGAIGRETVYRLGEIIKKK